MAAASVVSCPTNQTLLMSLKSHATNNSTTSHALALLICPSTSRRHKSSTALSHSSTCAHKTVRLSSQIRCLIIPVLNSHLIHAPACFFSGLTPRSILSGLVGPDKSLTGSHARRVAMLHHLFTIRRATRQLLEDGRAPHLVKGHHAGHRC